MTLHVEHVADLVLEGGGGIAAASGVAEAGGALYVVADDRHDLARFPLHPPGPGRLLDAGAPPPPADPAVRKRRKPDFEALVPLAGGLLALGSGSEPSRSTGLLWRLAADGGAAGPPAKVDLRPLHEALRDELPDLNLEGAAVTGDRLVLLQRGNGKGAVNAVVTLDRAAAERDLAAGRLSHGAVRSIRRHDLGRAGDGHLCFTDAAALPDGRGLVFTAVAELGESTYHDGRCAAAAVGVLTAEGMLAGDPRPIAPLFKVEGVHARAAGGGVELHLVADGDDPSRPAPLLRATL